MADFTNEVAAPDEPGTNDVTSTGAQTAGATNSGTEKTFTQADVDRVVKARLAEQQKSLATKFEKDLADKITAAKTEAQAELDKLVEDRLNARLAQQALEVARKTITEEFGLTEAQAARLQGVTADELRVDAEAIYGSFKQTQQKKPPVLRTGAGNDVNTVTFTRSQLQDVNFFRQNRDAILRAQAAGRIVDDVGV